MWNESDFVEHAKDIAAQRAVSKKTINDLAYKVAEDNSLNPDAIRTLIRLANVQVFQDEFRRKEGGDKMVEFDVGDPEQVIRKFAEKASTPLESANVNNDKLASYEVPFIARAKRLGYGINETEKVADYIEPEEKTTPRAESILKLYKLENDFNLEKIATDMQWEEVIDSLTQRLNKIAGYGVDYSSFEKDAIAEFGADVIPELTALRSNLRLDGFSKEAAQSVNRLVEDSPELRMIKKAKCLREDYTKFDNSLAWVQDKLRAFNVA